MKPIMLNAIGGGGEQRNHLRQFHPLASAGVRVGCQISVAATIQCAWRPSLAVLPATNPFAAGECPDSSPSAAERIVMRGQPRRKVGWVTS